MSADDYDPGQETIYLLRSPANARRLREAVARDKTGAYAVGVSTEELKRLVGRQMDTVPSTAPTTRK
jgi:antitoxin YefM